MLSQWNLPPMEGRGSVSHASDPRPAGRAGSVVARSLSACGGHHEGDSAMRYGRRELEPDSFSRACWRGCCSSPQPRPISLASLVTSQDTR